MNYSNYYNEIKDLVEIELNPKERIVLLRGILDKLFKDLTSNYKIAISGLQPRMAFYCQQENIPVATRDGINDLRIFCNRIVHNEIVEKPTNNNQKQCVKIILEFISLISKTEIPSELKSFYLTEKTFKPLIVRTPKKYEQISEIQGVLKNLSNEIKLDRFGKSYIDISVDSDDLGTVAIRITKTGEDDFVLEIVETAWEFAEILLTNISFDTQHQYYYSTSKTLIILEPNFIIDVKQIAECNIFLGPGSWGVNPLEYQKKKFEDVNLNENITKGYLLGNILDEIASDTPFSFMEKADEYFKSTVIPSLILKNSKGEEIFERLKIETQPQEKTIRDALRRFNNHKVSIEPSFLSIKYGIQGRLDALYENKSNINDKTVVELKSGNPNYSNPQHQTQTALYDLLLESAYPKRAGNSFILYSRRGENPLTLVNANESNIKIIQRKAMSIRNKIVSDEYKIAAGDLSSIYDSTYINELNPVEKLYFDGFCQFICNEIKIAKEKHRNTLLSNNDKNSSSKYLSNLEIVSVTEDYHIKLNINPKGEIIFELPDFKENDYVMLFPVEKDGTTQPLKHQILKSTIKEIDDNYITISLINKQLNQEYLKEFDRWAICQDLRESTLKRMYQQIYTLITSPLQKRKLLLSLEIEPRFDNIEYINANRLTEFQNKIVKEALSAKDYYLIQGPPGTGKTKYILTEIVKNLHKAEKIVVIAFTNQAVYEIAEELFNLKIDFIQLGGKGNMPYLLNNLNKELNLRDLIRKIENVNVILSTQHTLFTNLELLDSIKYQTLIVDEASQLLEPQIVGILTRFERFILIGDEKQLPAISLQEELEEIENPDLRSISLLKFNESLFYRLLLNAKKKRWDCYKTLKEQGRMHLEISEYPNSAYYGDQLEIISEDQRSKDQIFNLKSENPIERCLALKRVLYIPSERDKVAFKNDNERDLIEAFILTIERICKLKNIKIVSKSTKENELSVGVITPFRKQITNIKNRIPRSLKDLILVDSIEKFQGSERDIIFYSVSMNNKHQIEKLQSLAKIDSIEIDRKLNVALTRAKKHLIITGTRSIIDKSEHYKNLVQFVEKHGGLIQLTL